MSYSHSICPFGAEMNRLERLLCDLLLVRCEKAMVCLDPLDYKIEYDNNIIL